MDDIVAAIVLAAGRSTRMGPEDKLWADLDGEPVVGRTLAGVAALPELDVLVIVAPQVLHEKLQGLVPSREGLEVWYDGRREPGAEPCPPGAPARQAGAARRTS